MKALSPFLLLLGGVRSFPPTPFLDGYLANFTEAGDTPGPFCTWANLPSGLLLNQGSGLCLRTVAASASTVYLTPHCNASDPHQQWTWVGAEEDGSVMYAGADASAQLCLTGLAPLPPPPSALVLSPCAFLPWQQFTSDSDGNGTLSLRNLPGAQHDLYLCSPSLQGCSGSPPPHLG